MDWSTILAKLPDAVPTLLGAIVGGCIGVLAAAGGQYLSHWFTRRREREKLRREKAEALMDELFAQYDWLRSAQLEFYNAASEGATLLMPPSDRIRTLQVFYFPELRRPIDVLYEARQACLTFFRTHVRRQGSDYAAWQRTHDPHLFDPVHQDYLQAWFALCAALVDAAESRSWLRRLLRRMRRRFQKTPTIG